MNEYNIFQMVAIGSAVVVAMLLIGVAASGLLGGAWRWVNRDDTNKATWLNQRLLDVWDEQDGELGMVFTVTAFFIMILPQLVTLSVVYWTWVAPVALFVALLHLTRYGFDHKKLFNKHVEDVNAHKADES